MANWLAGRQDQPSIVNGVVTRLGLGANNKTDLSPIRALSGLKDFECHGGDGAKAKKAKLSDLSPLEGMKLSSWQSVPRACRTCGLAKLPLIRLNIYNTEVSDLAPLRGLKLTN